MRKIKQSPAVVRTNGASNGAKNDFHNIPAELKKLRRWVVWRHELRDGKLTKVPYDSNNNRRASCSNHDTWSFFDEAMLRFDSGGFHGIGFQLGSGLVGVDLDKCRDPKSGEIEQWAQEIITGLGTYAEISPSGTGVHAIGKSATLPRTGKKRGRVEMYSTGRFFTITGNHVDGTPWMIEERENELNQLHTKFFGKNNRTATSSDGTKPESASKADDAVLTKARGALDGERFKELWNGDGSSYPLPENADLGLCMILARHCGSDAKQVDRLFRKSKLFSEKWDAPSGRSTYGKLTIGLAIEIQAEVPGGIQSKHHSTDLGNTGRFVAQYGRDLRYCTASGKWMIWCGTYWKTDEINEVERLAKNTVRTIYAEARHVEDEETRKKIIQHALKSEAKERIRAIVELAKSEESISVTADAFDADPWVLNCTNGTLNLRTGTLQPHSREDLCSKQVCVDFTPDAECPTWLSFLERVMAGNKSLIGFIQRAVGYSLTGITTEQVLFVLYGTGANGKTTLIETITTLLGNYAQQADFEAFVTKKDSGGPRNDLARLKGARFVPAVEAAEGRSLAENVIKQVTGSDKIVARFLYHEHFEFYPQFKLVLVSNHKPKIEGTDEAIWRRIRLVPWAVTIPADERDKKLLEKLKAELPGILAWAARGCIEWQKNGLGDSPDVSAATQAYRSEMDVLAGFVEDYCVTRPELHVTASAIYFSYRGWCRINAAEEMSQTAFGSKLRERGLEAGKDKQGNRCWFGIDLRMNTKEYEQSWAEEEMSWKEE